jgi:G:T-mismatch repair DNA endonuclease (very short patch repair protein)
MRSRFWKEKIRCNRQRDRQKRMALRKRGLLTVRIWEHELRDSSNIDKVIAKIFKTAI